MPRLLAFARDQFSRGRGILWSSQRAGLTRLLENSSFALCTPTGSGKTLVANLGLVKELLLRDHGEVVPLALYLVPGMMRQGFPMNPAGQAWRSRTLTVGFKQLLTARG